MRDVLHPADRLVDAMSRIYRYRMTTTSGGNLSLRDEDGSIWITPARVDKGALCREDIVRVLPDGSHSGRHKPSSEFPFHQRIYEARPDIRAIVHAHPVALVAFSICGRTPDMSLFAKSRTICGEVGFAPYALPGSLLLGERIAEVFAHGHDCVMLENHGVVVGGKDFQEAFERFETLEFTAKTIIKASMLGEVRYLTGEQLEVARTRCAATPEFYPMVASSRERDLRLQLCDFIHRGYEQRLLISTGGSFSVRLDEESFVITPFQADRAHVQPEDLVLMQIGAHEHGKEPSRAVRLHREIYARHAGVHAIVNATPVNATAFAVVKERLDTRTIPESYIFLREVEVLPFEQAYIDPAGVAASLRPDYPVSLIENDGALVLGKSILDAFDRLEILEATAEAVINSCPLGKVRPMDGAVIQELVEAFLS